MAKIIYACGDRNGAGSQLFRFLQHNSHHKIKIAAYLKSSQFIDHIDWTLDALSHAYIRNDRNELTELFGKKNIPAIGVEEALQLTQEIDGFEPDLVICDYEPIVSNIASSLGLRLWYCSPVHLYDGIEWGYGELRYNGLLAKVKQTLLRLPQAEKTLVYSPFGDLISAPKLKAGYEWVRPYHLMNPSNGETALAIVNNLERLPILSKLLNSTPPFEFTLFSPYQYKLSDLETQDVQNEQRYSFVLSNSKWAFLTGETSYLSDCLYSEINKIAISPSLDDPEELLNATLCRACLIGDDLGQVEYLERYAVNAISDSLATADLTKIKYLDIRNKITNLTEKINNETYSI